jgi:N-acyl-D-amino-acid deacylase
LVEGESIVKNDFQNPVRNMAWLATIATWALRAGGVYGQFNLPAPETPLLGAAASGNNRAVQAQLKAGADPNEGRLVGLPAVMFPLMMQNREMFQAFVEAGADLQVRDKTGATTLMWAVYNEDSDRTVIQQILNAGVDPNARDGNGDTALVWATRRGNATAVRILERAGASRDTQIRAAAQKALALLQKSSPQFFRISGCISCHHQVLPTMAMAIAREHGVAFSESVAVQTVEAMIVVWKNAREHMTMDAHRIPNPPINISYSLVGLGAAKYAKDEITEAMARFVTQHQQQDGSWRSQIRRPPMEASDITATALSLRAVQLYGNDAEGVSRAAQWLARQEPRSTEERAMQVLGLGWARADRTVVDRRARELLTRQLPGGGWSQLDTPEADAYATGQALVALYTAGVVQPSDPVYQEAVDYLLRTQLADGSWLVVSRSFPFQPYKESGFPHGKDQWISAAGTSWASMALSLAVGESRSAAVPYPPN